MSGDTKDPCRTTRANILSKTQAHKIIRQGLQGLRPRAKRGDIPTVSRLGRDALTPLRPQESAVSYLNMTGLLSDARDGWDGGACQYTVGSLGWMAWRSGIALKEAGLGRPAGVTVCRPLAALPGQTPSGVFVTILVDRGPAYAAIFRVAKSKWTFGELQQKDPSPLESIGFWMQRRGWV
jgi:hypothetical protein